MEINFGNQITETEKEIEKFIANHYSFENLPPEIKKYIGNSLDTWKTNVIRYSVRHQLRWKNNLVKNFVTSEKAYYQGVIKFAKQQFMLYPYHLQDVFVKGLRETPFKYYIDMMTEVMMSEKSYEIIPNFTAADAFRLIGVGRNQFIDTMNTFKSENFVLNQRNWFGESSNVEQSEMIRKYLPVKPLTIPIQHWWIAHLGVLGEKDIHSCTKVEHAIIDLLMDEGAQEIGKLPFNAVNSLYHKGLIYFDIPILNNTIIIVKLKDFVMNRISGDYFETLLYTLIVSFDERTSILELSVLLDEDVEFVKIAASLLIRLGFATKKDTDPITYDNTDDELNSSKWHISWKSQPKIDSLEANQVGRETLLSSTGGEDENVIGKQKRIGLLFDHQLAAYMMCGNINQSAKFKNYAVTMFEVGKISEEQMDDFLSELEKVDQSLVFSEGDVSRYTEHIITLRNTLRFLRHNIKLNIDECDGGVELLRCERLNSVAHHAQIRLLSRSYKLIISIAPLACDNLTITSCIPHHFGPVIPEMNSVWFKLFIYQSCNSGPDSILYPKGYKLNSFPDLFLNCETVILKTWTREAMKLDVSYLLPNLNQALLSSPVLVQAYSYKKGIEPVFCDITFPLKPVDFDRSYSNLGESLSITNERDFNAANLHLHPLISFLGKHFNLYHSCGIVRLMLLDDGDKLYRWVPYEILYGMPLYDININKQLCEKIEKFGLFQKESLSIFTRNSTSIVTLLLNFIARSCVDEKSVRFVNNDCPVFSGDDYQELTNLILKDSSCMPTEVVIWSSSLPSLSSK